MATHANKTLEHISHFRKRKRVVRTARAQHSLGHLPLVVITHGKDLDASWQPLQNDLASLSSNSTHLIASGSGHAIMFDQPDLVIAAIKQVVTGQKMIYMPADGMLRKTA